MLKKTITYTDFDGNQRTETFHFNLTKAECTEMAMSENGGLDKAINRMLERQNAKEVIAFFKDFIFKSFGVKSLDGRRFEKSKEISEEFSQTEAYSELFQELCYNADAAAAFVNAIIPKDIVPEDILDQNQKAIYNHTENFAKEIINNASNSVSNT